MFVVSNLPLAICFCVVTMLGWGSWANTQKLTGKDHWPFQLFYWDYAVGVLLCALLFAVTLGSHGEAGLSALANLHTLRAGFAVAAVLSGVIFNLANILVVIAIDAAGMAIAFPIGVGLALVLGTLISYVQSPKGKAVLIFAGVALILVAIVLSAVAHSRMARAGARRSGHGVLAAAVGGAVMGLFYPQFMRSVSPEFNSAPIRPGMLTPYLALVFFGLGVVVSNFVWNTVFMRVGRVTYAEYFRGSLRLHSIGVLGGAIWMTAFALNVIASSVAGPAVSYALGQGATFIAALWGLLIWREFRDAPRGTGKLVAFMLAGYAAGLVSIAAATF